MKLSKVQGILGKDSLKSVLTLREGRKKDKITSNIMANPIRSILLEYQMIVDGVLLRERKELTKTLNETGIGEIHLTHWRKNLHFNIFHH